MAFSDLGIVTDTGSPSWTSRTIKAYYNKVFLDNNVGLEVLGKYAKATGIPANLSKTIEWTRVAPRTKVSAATEGTNPTATRPTATVITATLAEYADAMTFSSLFSVTTFDRLEEYVKAYKQGMIETREWVYMVELCTGAGSAIYSNSKTGLGSLVLADTAAPGDLARIRKALSKNKAKRFPNGYFKLIVNASILDKLFQASGATNLIAASYQGESGDKIRQWKMFQYAGVEIEEDNLDMYYVNASNVNGGPTSGIVGVQYNVVRCPAFGMDSFAGVKVDAAGRSPYSGQYTNQIIIKVSNDGDTSNPTNAFGTLGYRFVHTAKVINTSSILNYCVPDTDYCTA
jgi:hypothetical protein